ncbi:hypothetical protein [Sphingomonas japonica]|nr:hypothetical protein [Sphingomonas japonica]
MFRKLAVPILVLALVGGCSRRGELVTGGISAVRSACPSVAVAAQTGDITLFDPVTSRDASAIDVTATLTNVRSTCAEGPTEIVTTVTFDVLARRTRTDAARSVTLPYYVAVLRGGSQVTAKRVGNVAVQFAAGEGRAQTSGQVTSSVNTAAATLPEAVRERLTRRRRPGDEDAAVDPLADPEIRAQVLNSTFETIVGFQLTADQLKYNATR